jgi:hypothetical protein
MHQPIPWVLLHRMTGLDHEWGVDLYGELLEIGGGKERMTKYFLVSLAVAG